jgi:hypothetical protein
MESLLPQMFPDFEASRAKVDSYSGPGPNGGSRTTGQPSAEAIEQYATETGLGQTGRSLLGLAFDPGARKDFMKVVGPDRAPAMVMEMAGQFEARNAERNAAAAEQRQAALDRQMEMTKFLAGLELDAASQALDEEKFLASRDRLKSGDIIQLPEDMGGSLAQVYENTMTGRSVVSVPGQGQVALEEIPGATIADKGTGPTVNVSTAPMGGSSAETIASPVMDVELSDSAAFLEDMSDEEIQNAVSFLGSGASLAQTATGGTYATPSLNRLDAYLSQLRERLVMDYVNAFPGRTDKQARDRILQFIPKPGGWPKGKSKVAAMLNDGAGSFVTAQMRAVQDQIRALSQAPPDPSDYSARREWNQRMRTLENRFFQLQETRNDLSLLVRKLGPDALYGSGARDLLEESTGASGTPGKPIDVSSLP